MGWREYADEVRQTQHVRHVKYDSPPGEPIVPFVSNVPEPLPPSDREAGATLGEWRAGLATLAYSKPPSGMTTMRWGQLLDDAEFIFNGFGEQLVREGWSTRDVFGVLTWREGGGVLLDRLQGARNLKLDGEGRAFWSHHGVTMQTCRGAAESLMSCGLVLLWELKT